MTGLTRTISNPLVRAEAGAGGGVSGPVNVAHVVASVFSDYETTTTVTMDIPAEAQAGDLLVLVGFVRATRTEPASGWTEEVDRIETGSGEVDQRLQVLTQIYDGVATDVEYGTASSLRMGASLTVIRNATGIADIAESDMSYRGSNGLAYALPEVTNSGTEPRLCVQCYTSSYTENSNSSTTTTTTIGGADVMNLHNTTGTYGGASNSWARLGAFAFEVGAGDSKTVTLPYSAIDDRATPTIPHCYFFVENSEEILVTALGYIPITIPATSVDATLTNFPFTITGRDLPTYFWDSVTTGQISLETAAGATMECEEAYLDIANRELRFHAVIASISDSVDTELRLYWNRAPVTTGTVYDDYEAVISFEGSTSAATVNDHSGNSMTLSDVGSNHTYADGRLILEDSSSLDGTLPSTPTGIHFHAVAALGDKGQYSIAGIGTSSGNRVNLVTQSGNDISLFDGANSWLNSGVDQKTMTDFAICATIDDATERKVYVNGELEATDGTVSAITYNDTLSIGESATGTEDWRGSIKEVRIRYDYPADAFVKLEALNMLNQGDDYTVGSIIS